MKFFQKTKDTLINRTKAEARALAKRLGYTVQKNPRVAFPGLERYPRYVEREVSIAGNRFHMADADSFVAMYQEIFEDEIYRFDTLSQTPFIIDCGANHGVSVLYFKSQYPEARIKAIEADPRIFNTLSSNIAAAHLTNVQLLNRAVSDSDGPLTFYSEGADAGRTFQNADAPLVLTVDGITLDELIDAPVDFLKIDIEGAETKALGRCTKLHMVEQIFIEYHSFAGQPQVLAELLDILSKNGFRYFIHTQLCSPRPLTVEQIHMGMDLQLNIFAKKAPLEEKNPTAQ